jgi:hypothetical protein
MEIEADLNSNSALQEILRTDPPPGVSLSCRNAAPAHGFGFGEVASFTVEFSKDVAIGVVTNWLYDLLKGRARKIIFKKANYSVSEEDIKHILSSGDDPKSKVQGQG